MKYYLLMLIVYLSACCIFLYFNPLLVGKRDYFHEQYKIVTDESMNILRNAYMKNIYNNEFYYHLPDTEIYNALVESLHYKQTQDSLLATKEIQSIIKTLEKRTEITVSSLSKYYKEAFNEDLPWVNVPDIGKMINVLAIPESDQLHFALLLSLKKVVTSKKRFCKRMNEYETHGVYFIDSNDAYSRFFWYRKDVIYYLDSLFVNNTYIPVKTNPFMIPSILLSGEETKVRMVQKDGRDYRYTLHKEGMGIIIE